MSDNGGPASEKTLLDEFAGQIAVGLVQLEYGAGITERFSQKHSDAGPPSETPQDYFARTAYTVAAALVAEKRRLESAQPPISTS